MSAVLAWSHWRRWHQAWARYHHYRRRTDGVAHRPAPSPESPPRASVDEVLWSRLESLLRQAEPADRRLRYDRREILNAILYLMETGGAWRSLPAHFPPWHTVYMQLRQWQVQGIWEKLWVGLGTPTLKQELQL